MFFENAELADNFFPFFVLWDSLSSRYISDINGYVPLERRPFLLASLLRCAQRIDQALATFP